ncbi:MAG: hypothetical protein IT317_10195 [Anaerolineales bacterium]|nr:hypothetical protein [Anaerolineales bacterium]
MTTPPLRPARGAFLERHAWKGLLGVSLILGLFGLMDLTGGAADLQNGETVLMHSLTNMSWQEMQAAHPAAANLVNELFRSNGASLITLAALSSAICLTAFRRGERWAWYALWALPVWMALVPIIVWTAIVYPQYGVPVPVISGSILAGLCVVCLVGSFRAFFPRAPRGG